MPLAQPLEHPGQDALLDLGVRRELGQEHSWGSAQAAPVVSPSLLLPRAMLGWTEYQREPPGHWGPCPFKASALAKQPADTWVHEKFLGEACPEESHLALSGEGARPGILRWQERPASSFCLNPSLPPPRDAMRKPCPPCAQAWKWPCAAPGKDNLCLTSC